MTLYENLPRDRPGMGRSDGGVGDEYKLDEAMEVLNRGLLLFWAAIWMDDGGLLSPAF